MREPVVSKLYTKENLLLKFSIPTLVGTLTGAPTPDQSEPGSNGN